MRINTENAPAALGPYSQAIKKDNLCFVSMQLGLNPSTGEIVSREAKEQTRQAIKNVEAILKKCELSLKDVVKATLYITDLNDFAAVNEVYAEYFANKPARSLVVQAAMPKDAKVALDVIATRGDDLTDELDYRER
ncbi:Rid family detoxifying hydrolase [Hippea maritima]|uniref:Endoribonuclease L-PSP n=1 Tax=Hippea maritima (strain ATCC 700847 / DSM 10411 / MH2) TaxID=760142 RepID=F2LTM7_HIPMA|nr:Rid family detoxifying hydrolase [Hippea maritima]AEA33352.1 endoribonuclease L-PSP [Hippea maritima DSM 10411]